MAGRATRGGARWLICLATVAIAATAPLSAKRKDDRVVLVNGDRLVGEIKELAQGELRFKTAYILDTFHIDWRQVQELESRDVFRVATNDGRRLVGSIARRADGSFVVSDAAGAALATVQWSDVVGVLPIERSIWAQLTGQINSGFSYTSGDSETQFSASGSVGYIADRYAFDLSGSSSLSHHADNGEGSGSTGTSRNTAELVNQFPIQSGWFAGALVGLLNSDQQDLQLRTTAGGGIGRWLAPSQFVRITLMGGFVYTHEHYVVQSDTEPAGAEITDNFEAFASVRFVFHRFKTTDITSSASVYPSVSSLGRVRLNVAPTLNLEIVRNLYWNFTLYENYDSRPPVNATKNDFGVTNSLGWKF